MPDAPFAFLAVAGLLAVGLLALVVVLVARRSDSPGRRLAVRMRQRSDYLVFLGVPPANPDRWAAASGLNGDAVVVEGHGEVPLAEVRLFVVAYPGGQLVDCEMGDLPEPPGVFDWGPEPVPDIDVLKAADLEEGRKYVHVSYGPSELRPRDRGHYSTTLTNVSGQRVRVLRFAGYKRTPLGWVLHTVTGGFFSAEEFREWYGQGEREWLGPGESACDPNNYGGPPVLWAYYCQAEDGSEFIAGGVLE
jgi:hypothetical protein